MSKSSKFQNQARKQVLNVKGYTLVLKETRKGGGVFKFAGVYTGMTKIAPKYIIQVRDVNDLMILKGLLADKDAIDEILKHIEKFIVG